MRAANVSSPPEQNFGEHSGCEMVEIILSEHQLACLKAAAPKGSIERAALDAGDYFAGSGITSEPIARHAHMHRGSRAAAARHCPNVVP